MDEGGRADKGSGKGERKKQASKQSRKEEGMIPFKIGSTRLVFADGGGCALPTPPLF